MVEKIIAFLPPNAVTGKSETRIFRPKNQRKRLTVLNGDTVCALGESISKEPCRGGIITVYNSPEFAEIRQGCCSHPDDEIRVLEAAVQLTDRLLPIRGFSSVLNSIFPLKKKEKTDSKNLTESLALSVRILELLVLVNVPEDALICQRNRAEICRD